MSQPPHFLQSQHINPASLVELRVLSQVADRMQKEGNIKGSIPYQAKICQIVDNQQTEDKASLDQIRAQAHAQLADAYFKSQQFVQCEATLSFAVKIWEKSNTSQQQLLNAYDQLKACYETLGKQKLAEYMDQRKAKLVEKPVCVTSTNKPLATPFLP